MRPRRSPTQTGDIQLGFMGGQSASTTSTTEQKRTLKEKNDTDALDVSQLTGDDQDTGSLFGDRNARRRVSTHHRPDQDGDGTARDNRSHIVRICDLLRPEIFLKRLPGSARTGETAWMDGLRGAAAFAVCIVHLAFYTHPLLDQCFGHQMRSPEAPHDVFFTMRSPAALPIVRLFFSGGHFAVMVFFVISGYVLTKRPLQLLQQGKKDEFSDAVQSALFRRPVRLFVPVYVTTLFLAVFWHVTGVPTPWPPRQANLWRELVNWVKQSAHVSNPMRGWSDQYTSYNIHTWTLPVELRGSLLVFCWMLATMTSRPRTRIWMGLGMIVYLWIVVNGAWYACFVAGMVTAEADLMSEKYSSRQQDNSNSTHGGADYKLPWQAITDYLDRRPDVREIFWHVTLTIGLLLAGCPSHTESPETALAHCTGWSYLYPLLPKPYRNGEYRWFWLFPAAALTFVSISHIAWLRRLFTTRPMQYLGRHSFSLYLTHGPLIGLISERLFYATRVKTPSRAQAVVFRAWVRLLDRIPILHLLTKLDKGPYGLELNFLFCVVVSLPAFLYVAEISTKLVDAPTVRLSKWLYRRLLPS